MSTRDHSGMSPSFSEDLLDAYLAAYLAGEPLPDDVAAKLRAYLNATPARRGFLEGVMTSVRGTHIAPRPSGAALRDRLMAALDDAEGRPPHDKLPAPSRWRAFVTRHRVAMWSGVCMLALCVLWGGYQVAAHKTSPPIGRTYQAYAKQAAQFTLPDGTRVGLAPNSVLEIGDDFGKETRTARLVYGEAYFRVTTSGGAPFIVNANGIQTRVLGTEFLVRRYGRDSAVYVTVVSGKVELAGRSMATPLVLMSGHMGVIADSMSTPRVMPATGYVDWDRGLVIVNRMPSRAAVAFIGRQYGYTIKLSDPTAFPATLTLALPVSDPIRAFQLLASVSRSSWLVNDSLVTFMPQKPVTRRH